MVNSHGNAISVCYNGVCHYQLGVEMSGPFGLANSFLVLSYGFCRMVSVGAAQ